MSIVLGYRVMRGTADGARFVSAVLPEPGLVEWTSDRETSVLFGDRADAEALQEMIVLREERCAAVVPAGL